MWIGIKTKDFLEFASSYLLYINEQVCYSSFLDTIQKEAELWIKVDSRYRHLGYDFIGPFFFHHIEHIIPVNEDARKTLIQYYNMFEELKIIIGKFDE